MIGRVITTGTAAGFGLARLPLRAAGRLMPAQWRGVVELAADQTQATTESLLGSVLHVDELAERGRLRQAAVDQRAEAVRLWGHAGDARRLADLKLAQDRNAAAARRDQAEEQQVEAAAAAEEARQAGLRKVEQAEQQRKAAVRKATAKRKADADDQANKRRLKVLDAEEAALDVADDAATATDEADRLAKKAAETKARRKTG